jgi:hypothetical protein
MINEDSKHHAVIQKHRGPRNWSFRPNLNSNHLTGQKEVVWMQQQQRLEYHAELSQRNSLLLVFQV